MRALLLLQNSGVFSTLKNRFIEGGPFFMSLILICLLAALLFLVLSFLSLKTNIEKSKKMTRLASDISVLGLVFGFMGSTIGMITAFDSYEAFGGIDARMMAGGLKIAFLTTLFGCITFIIPRIGIIILKGLQKV